MGTFRTHYDNLKVARDAPDLVIRAAYKSLSQRFHPDKNPGDERAAKVMAIINQSYAVLCDPVRRQEHDAWIARMEAQLSNEPSLSSRPPNGSRYSSSPQAKKENPIVKLAFSIFSIVKGLVLWAVSYAIGVGVVICVIALIAFVFDRLGGKQSPPPGPKPYTAVPTVQTAQPIYAPPTTAPNGEAWPDHADYVVGYPILADDGLSEVTVDNGQNDSSVFVKLVSLDGSQAFPVRQFFIPENSSFTLRDVSPGSYDIRYRDLNSGELFRSGSFVAEQIPTPTGTQYSTITMTLYKVQGGNLQTYDLAESEF